MKAYGKTIIFAGSMIRYYLDSELNKEKFDYQIIAISETSLTHNAFFHSLYLSHTPIQPVGGLKSFTEARKLLQIRIDNLLPFIEDLSEITIVAHACCIIGNNIDYLIEHLPSSTAINIFLATPLKFEGNSQHSLSNNLVTRINNLQHINLALYLFDGKDNYGAPVNGSLHSIFNHLLLNIFDKLCVPR